PGRLRAARRRVQALRRIHDSDLRELQVGAGLRLREFFVHHLHSDQRLRNLGRASRNAVDNVSDRLHRPATVAFLGFVVLLLFGSRDLLTRGVPAVGDLAAWPGIHSLFDAYGSAWRFTGLGSSSPAPPALALMGALGTVLFGAVGLARTLFVVAAIPFGVLGAYRLSRSVISLLGPALAAALAYGINPAPRNAIALGRLGPLVVFAVLPFLLHGVLRAAGMGEADQPDRPPPARSGRILRLAVLAALGAAFYPALL